MSAIRGFASWLRLTGLELAGWLLVIAGIAALVLPGPGLLMMVAGLAILSNRYEWARRRVEPIKAKAFDAARYGVATWPRIALSVLGALCVMGVGVIWWIGPTVPEIGPFGDELPFNGWATGLSMMLSSLIALGLVVYSMKRFRYGDDDESFEILDEDELVEALSEADGEPESDTTDRV
ncbi:MULTISPECIES: PGPGW domain-containing protein [Mumia]|uniref:PGPGW domain-containing protein n=1 Tax=Mumia TaxID=1546255 RepID=UPI0014241A93|nr:MULTISPECIES: PGPGW domain-containing protein [unclassified Mumia]QMW67068.1 PGPGW domain-containing protein [Mumia sp. ZJ1417]